MKNFLLIFIQYILFSRNLKNLRTHQLNLNWNRCYIPIWPISCKLQKLQIKILTVCVITFSWALPQLDSILHNIGAKRFEPSNPSSIVSNLFSKNYLQWKFKEEIFWRWNFPQFGLKEADNWNYRQTIEIDDIQIERFKILDATYLRFKNIEQCTPDLSWFLKPLIKLQSSACALIKRQCNRTLL